MLNNIISIVSVIFALMSVIISFYIYRASRTDTSYLDIDKQYSDLLELGLNEPDLRDYTKTSMFYKLDPEDNFKRKYHIYAYMCWNLIETIFDRQKDKKGRFKLSETWLPVMFEENRLHYTWFKHNSRLFKSDFQKFVTSELNDIDILEGSISDLKDVYARFQRDFPADERKDYSHLEKLMEKGKYRLLLARHKVFNEIIGYAFVYQVDNHKALWLDYMAVDVKFQNAGYGTLLFNKIAESKEEGIVGMFLEVEIPKEEDEDYQEQIRRIKFYERLGAKRLEFKYELPTNNGGFPMLLYFRPSSNVRVLPKEQIKDTIISAFEYIHSDVNQKATIQNAFISEVSDAYFD